MSARDGHVRARKTAFHIASQAQQVRHERFACPGIGGGEFRLGHQQHVAAVPAEDAPVQDLSVAEARLQWQDLGQHQRAHANRISGDDVLEHHPFRPSELAPHHREEFAHLGRFEL